MQAESNLDNVRNPFAGQALSLLILEGVGIAACRQEPLFEMLSTNDAEMLRRDRLAVLAPRCEQLADASAIDLINAEELSERLMRAANFFEDFALNASAGKPAKLADEFPHGA